MSSYEQINYGLRPAKSIERKMLAESFIKMENFKSLSEYRYIGFGSPYFSDFALFHRHFGFKEMISIEKDIVNMGRFDFNIPYSCIEMMFGHSNAELPKISWDKESIVWLDYDGKLDGEVLTDLGLVVSNIKPGSLLIVTVNVHPETGDEIGDEKISAKRLEKLIERVGKERIPLGLSGRELAKWGLAYVSGQVIHNLIEETLVSRNGGRSEEKGVMYKQVYNFNYADGVKMLTIGGVFYENGQRQVIEKCDFEGLTFYKDQRNDPYSISVPSLTFKEIRHLNNQLPIENLDDLEGPSIPENDLANYGKVYRYFPTFTEADV